MGADSRIIFFHVTRERHTSYFFMFHRGFVCKHFSVHLVCSHSPSGGLRVSVSPSNEPLLNDHVNLTCKADRQIYSKLAWYRVTNISESEQVASVQPCRSLTLQPRPLLHAVQSNQQGTNITLVLPLPSASRRDEGLYACQVENIKTGDKTCLLRRLTLKGKNVNKAH